MIAGMPLRLYRVVYIIPVAEGLEAQRHIEVQGGREVVACDDLERDMLNTLQAGND
jgi:hypothetical protein